MYYSAIGFRFISKADVLLRAGLTSSLTFPPPRATLEKTSKVLPFNLVL